MTHTFSSPALWFTYTENSYNPKWQIIPLWDLRFPFKRSSFRLPRRAGNCSDPQMADHAHLWSSPHHAPLFWAPVLWPNIHHHSLPYIVAKEPAQNKAWQMGKAHDCGNLSVVRKRYRSTNSHSFVCIHMDWVNLNVTAKWMVSHCWGELTLTKGFPIL